MIMTDGNLSHEHLDEYFYGYHAVDHNKQFFRGMIIHINFVESCQGLLKRGRSVLLTILLAVPSAHSSEMDNRTITCRAFLASGQANMAALISWLRGYHAGKTGIVPYQSPDPYGGKLGFYCKQHPDANLIEASEQILTALDRDI
jgi:acid stress chaperone HdeB